MSQAERSSEPTFRAPVWVFSLQLIYLLALVSVGLLYVHWHPLRVFLPSQAGPIPLAVSWWGALGGITISLTGIFRNADKWQSRYELWHIARPFVGAVIGSVAYLIFVVLIRATGTSPTHEGGTSSAVYYLIAFLAGYREEIFRQLLKRATDSLFAPAMKDRPEEEPE